MTPDEIIADMHAAATDAIAEMDAAGDTVERPAVLLMHPQAFADFKRIVEAPWWRRLWWRVSRALQCALFRVLDRLGIP